MNISFDRSANAVYIGLSDVNCHVSFTYPCDPVEVNGMINLDFSENGELIGIEVMDATSKLPPSFIEMLEARSKGKSFFDFSLPD
jgi:uncharacterized protein YuzE